VAYTSTSDAAECPVTVTFENGVGTDMGATIFNFIYHDGTNVEVDINKP